MATTDLKLEECGSLPKPGPIGRLVRLIFGILCLHYVKGLWMVQDHIFTDATGIRPLIINGILPGLLLVSYIINIGYSRSWGKRPAIVSAAFFALIAGFGYFNSGNFETLYLAMALHLWEFYLFAHLGLCFVFAALIRTPGCEMRALHHLYTLITGVPTKEHHCPVGPLQPIDNWEAARKISQEED